ncbi:MAG: hypothetical protein AAF937_03160 [Planctomycetota bacterium]
MLKFLRKYNKIILVIGGSLLMVAFLAPQAIQQIGTLQNRTVARMDGREIKERELFDAANELRALNALGGTGGTANALLNLDQATSSDADLHWYLLSKEAEAGGFVGSDEDGRSYYSTIAEQFALLFVQSTREYQGFARQLGQGFANQLMVSGQLPGLAPEQQFPAVREAFLGRLQQTETNAAGAGRFTSIEELHRAVAKMRGIQRMRAAYLNIARPSDRRLRAQGSEVFRGLQTDFLVIPASRFIDDEADPTEAEIIEHFEARADANPTEDDFGIGYLQPQRIKLEWLRIDRQTLLDAIDIPIVEISKRWQLERDVFPGEFAEEQEQVRAVLEDERVAALLQVADRAVKGESGKSTRELARDGAYLELPDNWQDIRPPLEQIAQAVADRLREREGVEIPVPAIERRDTTWQNVLDLRQVNGFAFGSVRVGSQNVAAAGALLQVRELNPNPNLPIQVGVLAAEHPITAADGSLTFYRVLDARDTSPPDSIEEVRDEVVENIKTLRAYDRLSTELPGYLDVAKSGGLEAVADAINASLADDSEDRVEVQSDVNISTNPQGVPPVFASEDVLDELFRFAETIDPTVEPESIPEADRTYAVLSPRQRSAVVGLADRYVPLTVDDFRVLYGQARRVLTDVEIAEAEARDDPFSLKRMIERHRWTPIGGEQDTDAASPAASDEQTEPAAEG